jgi:hypothetical protein
MLTGTAYVAHAETANPKALFGKNIVYGANNEETTLGDRWNMLNNELKEAENLNYLWAAKKIAKANQIYADYFKEAALEVDPRSDEIIEEAFSYNSEYIKTKDLLEASFNRQAIDKTIYKIAFMKLENALDDGDADSFLKWFAVMEKKFAISKNPDLVTNTAITEIKENPDKIHHYKETIKSELLNIFKLKTIEEIEEAIAAADQGKTNDAIKFTYEGYYYSRTAHPHLVGTLGQEDADKIESNMKMAMGVARSGAPNSEIKSELEQILKNIEPGVKGHQGQSAVGLALNSIKDRLHLVEEEYRDAVTDGKITNQVEYDETVIFLQRAASILDENKADLEKLDKDAISKIETNLEQIDGIVDSIGEFSNLEPLVKDSLGILDGLTEKSGTSENSLAPDYFANIEKLLEKSKAQYASGNTQDALDLAREAYLDNYEFLEAPIAEHDKELMEEIEIMMRIELADMIKNNDDKSKINDRISTILEKLGKAESLLSQADSPTNSPSMSPIKQLEGGVEPKDVECRNDKVLIMKKFTNTSACVTPETLSRLVEIGWGVTP